MDVRFREGRNHRREARVRAAGSNRLNSARSSVARVRRIFFLLDKDLHGGRQTGSYPGRGFSETPNAEIGGETFQTNLIMPEPCPFLSRNLPRCSIIRPTKTEGIAMSVVQFLTAMGLFIGQPNEFFELLHQLAAE